MKEKDKEEKKRGGKKFGLFSNVAFFENSNGGAFMSPYGEIGISMASYYSKHDRC